MRTFLDTLKKGHAQFVSMSFWPVVKKLKTNAMVKRSGTKT